MFRIAAPTVLWRALLVAAALTAGCGQTQQLEETRQATGIKIGEVRQTSAVLWARLTASRHRNEAGTLRRSGAAVLTNGPFDAPDPATLEGAVPGAPGRIRVRIGISPDLIDATATEWAEVDETTDYAHQFRLTSLAPATRYYYAVDTTNASGSVEHRPREGTFQTAPSTATPAPVTLAVMSGTAYEHTDHPEGFRAHNAIAKLRPDFLVMAGNSVYYDSDPLARTRELARYHWQRMYGLPTLARFHLQFPAYWLKGDHDVYMDDAWPGLKRDEMGAFAFEDGVEIFREQTPVSGRPYRTFRWGRDVQLWLLESRDFRSQNPMPDGPEKSILGKEQRNWLTDTISASDATWKLLVSPTPIIGPDRLIGRFDNHANPSWQSEGQMLREYFAGQLGKGFFVIAGDPMWQYHSVDPETGLQEFAPGPASDAAADGAAAGNETSHRFHKGAGGFLTVSASIADGQPEIVFRHHTVDGDVVYEHRQR